MSIHQHATLEETVYFWFGSNDTGGSGDDGAAPLADVRLAGAGAGIIPVLSPVPALLTHANYPAGCYELAVAATAANGFAATDTYGVFCTLTVDGENPTGFVGSFTLDPIIANITEISDDAPAAANLETAYDGGAYAVGGGSIVAASVSGAVGSVTGAVGSVTGAVGSVTGAVGSVTGAVGSVTGAVGSVTGAVGSVTGAVGSVGAGGIVAATFGAGAIDATAIAADAIGSSELATTAVNDIADGVWDEDVVTAHNGANSAGSLIDDLGTPANFMANVAALALEANVQGHATAALNAYDPPTDAEMIARTILAAAYFDPGADTVATVTSVGSVAGAVGSVTGAVGSVTGAVGSVTGNVGGNVTGSVGSVAAGGIAAASFAANAITAAALAADAANEIADATLSRDVDQVEATMALHSLGTAILKAVARIRDNAGTYEVYRTDGITLHMSQTVTTDALNDPIDELTVGV